MFKLNVNVMWISRRANDIECQRSIRGSRRTNLANLETEFDDSMSFCSWRIFVGLNIVVSRLWKLATYYLHLSNAILDAKLTNIIRGISYEVLWNCLLDCLKWSASNYHSTGIWLFFLFVYVYFMLNNKYF